MKKINTRLTQNVVDQISKSGMSVYAFIDFLPFFYALVAL